MKLTKIFISLIALLFIFSCDEPTKSNNISKNTDIIICDDCGVCDTDSNNNNITCTDCSGELNGEHIFDECNICDDYAENNGVKPEYPYGNCDCRGKTIQIDEAGITMGHAKLDDCGECNPGIVLTGPFGFIDIDCGDCNGELSGEAYKDGCGDCVGGSTGLDPCDEDCLGETIVTEVNCSDFLDLVTCDDKPGCTYESGSYCLPINYGYFDECDKCVTEPDENCIQICDCVWSNDENIPLEYPLCIALQNCQSECNTSENGECILIESAYYCVEYENWNDMDCAGVCAIGTPKNDNYFRYCSTSGATFTESNYELCINDGCIDGECLPFVSESHSDAYIDDCEVCSGGVTGHVENSDKDCYYDCNGSAIVDNCGECVGGNSSVNGCEKDCAGDWGGTAVNDECGVCNGDNSSCADCAGVVNGDSLEDECGTCDADSSNDCVQACDGVWGGTAVNDECGVCNGDNLSCADCAGVVNGDSLADECDICDSDASNDCVQDCAGAWGGSAVEDECGVCGGGNSSCIDCANVANGDSLEDECGTCDADSSNDCVQDCNGIWGGNAIIDVCGICDGGIEVVSSCVDCVESSPADCTGECGGTAVDDECSVCNGDNSTCLDCANVLNGTSFTNSCGECVGLDDTSCVQGCDGVFANNGTHLLEDECGVCNGDNLSCADCAGVVNGDSLEDECGTCDADSSNDCVQDCSGDWGGSAVEDECGVCGGGNSSCIDCANVANGDSLEDECGTCDADSSNDCVQDCSGDWGGTSVSDDCVGVCIPPLFQSSVPTCVGGENNGNDCSLNGDLDCIGICRVNYDDPNFNSTCVQDCAGIWAGESILDECGDCDSNGGTCEDGTIVSTGSCCNGFPESETSDCVNSCDAFDFITDDDCIETCLLDCAGEWGGDHELDDCNFCDDYSDSVGMQPNYPYGNCGCFDETANNFWCNSENNACNPDGMDIQNSGAGATYCIAECVIDNNYVNPITENIGEIYTEIVESCEYWGCTDETAINYDESTTNCEDYTNSCCSYNNYIEIQNIDENAGTLDVYMDNTLEVGGFQFSISGATITGASGGSATDAGFMTSASGQIVLGFSLTGATIPAGSGVLTSLTFDNAGDDICFTAATISDVLGNEMNFLIHHNSLCSE